MSSDPEINPLLRTRRSGRLYNPDQPVTDEVLAALLEAARWAPSGGNSQPWRYVVTRRGTPGHTQLLNLLDSGNQVWAQYAPLLVLSCAQIVRVNAKGETVRNPGAIHDLGLANMSLVVQATALGMQARMMGGFNKDAARVWINGEASGIEPHCVMALGYPGDGAQVPADVRERETQPRSRKPVAELLLNP
jgi:nitroreductase